MNREAFALARTTLRTAVKEYAWRRLWHPKSMDSNHACYQYGPGKFEGEHWSIIHWYDASMNGSPGEEFYRGDELECEAFHVTDVERAAFALKPTTAYVALFYSSQGFVSQEEWTQGHFDNVMAKREIIDEED